MCSFTFQIPTPGRISVAMVLKIIMQTLTMVKLMMLMDLIMLLALIQTYFP